ncbi:MAG: DUF2953 domain-containing protein [Blautia sp.]|nr:DUF2953 domain-containing protein [Blautia sp.]MCM1201716.1 DUF2953 domain-containing protein [Bacteroides fragilis]
MLHILLLILKITGIIVGTLLAVLLVCLLLVLFVPVRYRIEAGRTEEEGAPPVEASAKITWLLHLLDVRIQYPADVCVRARIFLFTVFRLPPKQKKKSGRKASGRKSAESAPEDKREEGPEKAPAAGSGERPERAPAAGNKEHIESAGTGGSMESAASEPGTDRRQESVQGPEPALEPESEKQKIPLKEKLNGKIKQIQRIFQKIWYTFTGICDKIKTIWENIEYYRGILQSDTFRQAFSLCKEELFSLFSYIRPRKFQADLTIGMDDPAATGKILSYYGMLYPFIGGNIAVNPDFERKRIEGTVYIKGKIRLFTFVKTAVRLYFNKNIRKLLRMFKKEDE